MPAKNATQLSLLQNMPVTPTSKSGWWYATSGLVAYADPKSDMPILEWYATHVPSSHTLPCPKDVFGLSTPLVVWKWLMVRH